MSNFQSVLTFENINKPTDYVIVNPFKFFPNSMFTVELWFKTDHNNPGSLISYATNNKDNAFLLYDYRSIYVYISTSATQSYITFNDGKWHHCAITWSSSTGESHLYKDGQKEFSFTISQGQSISNDGALVLGQDQDSVAGSFDTNQAFRGQMADVRIWNCIRTPQEIKENMHYRLKGNESGLVLYWPLNEGSGNIVHDKTPNGNNGTIHGTTTWTEAELPVKDNSHDVLGTGLQDYAYWHRWKQSLPKSENNQPFRRGRIWC